MSKPLIILDRDGVINYDSDHYIKNEDEWLPIASSIGAIEKLTKAGYSIAIATNQSGLSRGFFTESTLDKIHQKMLDLIHQTGGSIDAIEYCPDHPDNAGPDRKPAPGMILKILNKFTASANETWFVGDSISDLECAVRSGCKPALVLTGKGERTIKSPKLDKNIPIFENLSDFVNFLLG